MRPQGTNELRDCGIHKLTQGGLTRSWGYCGCALLLRTQLPQATTSMWSPELQGHSQETQFLSCPKGPRGAHGCWTCARRGSTNSGKGGAASAPPAVQMACGPGKILVSQIENKPRKEEGRRGLRLQRKRGGDGPEEARDARSLWTPWNRAVGETEAETGERCRPSTRSPAGSPSGCVSLSCLPWFPGFPQMQRPCSPWKSPRTLLVQADPSVASFSGDPGLGPPGKGCTVSFLSLAWTCFGFSVSLTLRPLGPAHVRCRQGHTSASTACRTTVP